MFQLHCHRQGANTYITKSCSKKVVLQFLHMSDVQVVVEIYSV